MKITRILSFILCIVLSCTLFAGCKKEDGFTPFEYEEPTTVNLQFNLYIIADSLTDDAKNAMNTVNAKINQYFKEQFSGTKCIHTCAQPSPPLSPRFSPP